MSKQEAETLATGTVKSYKGYDYGIAGDQSHAHGLSMAEYIDNYLESNADDSNGYVHVKGFRHQNNLKTTVITVTHPETDEEILVVPYPWTEW
ncbi:hypothetical protein HW423_07410 [Aerococcaceae bacterium INB8]|uniref:Uncharacterized protein n=1 Tax=Ruoffia halotolerans TaxID=2748684 RepID=A0A839A5Y3_9LACT|nr:hypothetical protein [Ruoffia halotolerans]MBA5729609.1 hypothetical protein [Ruoffia halotolerans]